MTVINEGIGFGSNPANVLTTNVDYVFREIRGGSFGATITSIQAEIDAGNFIRAAGDATANGGLIVVARMAILKAKAGQIPPGPDANGTGVTPGSFRSNSPSGFSLLWQETVFAWPQYLPTRFFPGDIQTTDGDSSLYVVLGSVQKVLAGTIAVPGAISDIISFVLLSVSGSTYTAPQNQSMSPAGAGLRSLPRYATS